MSNRIKLQQAIQIINHPDHFIKNLRVRLKKKANIQTFIETLATNANQHIKSCSLSGSHFTIETIRTLVVALNNNPKIKTLKLNHCHITDEYAAELSKLKHIHYLHLNGNQITENGVNVLATNPALRSVYLSDNHLTKTLLKSDLPKASKLQKMVVDKNASVKEVKPVIASITIEHETSNQALEQFFSDKKNSVIGLLVANNMNLSDGAAISLAKSIKVSQITIEAVNFRGNKLSNLGAMFLLNSKLENLNLSYNQLTEIPAIDYIGTSKENDFFGEGQIGHTHQQIKHAFFNDDKQLKHLDLSGNKFSDKFLLKLIECRPTLETLNGKNCKELRQEILARQAVANKSFFFRQSATLNISNPEEIRDSVISNHVRRISQAA